METVVLSFADSVRLAQSYGIEMPRQVMFLGREEYDGATNGKLAYPLVLKAIPKDESHKTEKKLVITNLNSKREVDDAFVSLQQRIPVSDVECYVLQEQVHGIEFIVGGKKDSVFLQTLMFGMGGVYVELTSDFAIRVCPVDEKTAKGMLLETKAKAFFLEEGFRGFSTSLEAGAVLLAKTSQLLEDHQEIVEMDLNPVIATPEKFYAVDLRIIRQVQ